MPRLHNALHKTLPLLAFTMTTLSVLLTMPARAALPAAPAMQSQLQAEWDDFITRMHGAVTSTGELAVQPLENGYQAILPKLTINLQNSNRIQLDAMTVRATPGTNGAVDLNIILPASTPQYYQSRKSGTLTIGKQNTHVLVKPAGDTWQVQSVNATLGGLHWQQDKAIIPAPQAPIDTAIDQIKLIGKPSQMQLEASTIQMRAADGSGQTIGRLTLLQKASGEQSLRLSDVLVLLTGAVPQLETGHGAMTEWLQGAASMQAHVQNLRATKPDATVIMAIDDMLLQNTLVGPATAEQLTVRTTGTLKGIQLGVPAAFAATSPQTLDFASTVRNLPAAYLAMPFNTPQAKTEARAALAAAGTQLQIDSLNITARNGLKANGTGLLTATNTAPAYLSGNVVLNIENLQASLSQMQAGLRGDGGKMPGASQTVLALMLLQGMGKANGAQTQYIVSFMPNGEILLNNQDLSGLLQLGGIGRAPSANRAAPARAIPVAPVTDETPAMSGWKK